jgi:hypothetical protein
MNISGVPFAYIEVVWPNQRGINVFKLSRIWPKIHKSFVGFMSLVVSKGRAILIKAKIWF